MDMTDYSAKINVLTNIDYRLMSLNISEWF